MNALILSLTVSLAGVQAPSPIAGAATIERARALYDTAAYEEALSLLIAIENDENVAEVEEYRALCLLALGRNAEAERALEQVVVRKPLHTMDVADVSPKLVLLFRDVRQRMVPVVARSLYAQGKANFDARRYALATSQFQELITLLSSGDPASVAEGMPELRQLAEGFLALSGASSEPAVAVRPRPEPTADTSRVYSTADRGVSAPIEIVRPMPAGVEQRPDESPRLYQGLVEVVIDQQGRVQVAEIRRSITASYDAALLESTRDWRFQPALLRGTPVAYRKYFEVIVWGMSQRRTFGAR